MEATRVAIAHEQVPLPRREGWSPGDRRVRRADRGPPPPDRQDGIRTVPVRVGGRRQAPARGRWSPAVVAPGREQVHFVVAVRAVLGDVHAARDRMEREAEHVPVSIRVREVVPGGVAVERIVARGTPVRVHPKDLSQRAHRILRERRIRVLADDRVHFPVRPECDHAAVVVRRTAQGRHPEDHGVGDPGVPAREDSDDAIVDRSVREVVVRLVRIHVWGRGKPRVEREAEQTPLSGILGVRERVERHRQQRPVREIDDADDPGVLLGEEDPAIRGEREGGRKVQPALVDLDLTCGGDR